MGSLFGGQSGAEKQRDQDISSIVGDLRSDATSTGNKGKKLIKKGTKGMLEGLDFYKTLLTGDRAALSQVLSPELTATGQAYDNATQNLVEQGPRGAATSDSIGKIASSKASALGDIITKARPEAAGRVSDIGGQIAGIGLGEKGISSQEFTNAIAALMSQQQMAQQRNQQKSQAWGDLGGGIGGIIGAFL